MAYIKANLGGGSIPVGGGFPPTDTAIDLYGMFGANSTVHDLTLTPTFTVTQKTSTNAAGNTIAVIANVENFTHLTVTNSGTAYSGVYYYDQDGVRISGGETGSNPNVDFPAGTRYVTYCCCNYNFASDRNVQFAFT